MKIKAVAHTTQLEHGIAPPMPSAITITLEVQQDTAPPMRPVLYLTVAAFGPREILDTQLLQVAEEIERRLNSVESEFPAVMHRATVLGHAAAGVRKAAHVGYSIHKDLDVAMAVLRELRANGYAVVEQHRGEDDPRQDQGGA